MTAGFTPGPWAAHRYAGKDDSWFVRGPADERVCGQGSGCVREANARLIAEAPNLYRELSVRDSDLFMLRRAVEEGDPKAELLIRIDDMIRETKAALAKASAEQVSA